MEQAEDLLKHLGLTEYEARAYVTLVKYGHLTAERISSLGAIPLPRVYDTMLGLSKRGLVTILKNRPQIFNVIDTERLFKLLKEDEKRKMEKRLKEIEDIIPQLLKVIPPSSLPSARDKAEEIAYVRRKVNMEKVWLDLHSQAKKEILIFAGDLSWLNTTTRIIKKLLKDGIEYKVIWCASKKEIIPLVRKAVSLGIEIRYLKSIGDIRGIIVDGNKASLVEKVLEAISSNEKKTDVIEPESIARYTTITINSKLVVDIFRRYFLTLWNKAMPAERFLKKMK